METCLTCKFKWLGAAAGCALLMQPLMLWLLLLLMLLQVMSVVGILQDETDPMVSVMKVRRQCLISCVASIRNGGGAS